MRGSKGLFLLTVLILALSAEPSCAIGLGGPSPCTVRNAAEAFCAEHGGCPRDGYCYFPDGSYCEIWSFYNGTCPGIEYYEQAMWMAEANRFLYGDEGYYAYPPNGYAPGSYAPNGYAPNPYYGWTPYWPNYGTYWPNPGALGGI
jgi:putative hemolysin